MEELRLGLIDTDLFIRFTFIFGTFIARLRCTSNPFLVIYAIQFSTPHFLFLSFGNHSWVVSFFQAPEKGQNSAQLYVFMWLSSLTLSVIISLKTRQRKWTEVRGYFFVRRISNATRTKALFIKMIDGSLSTFLDLFGLGLFLVIEVKRSSFKIGKRI